jgi:hypothetical protein
MTSKLLITRGAMVMQTALPVQIQAHGQQTEEASDVQIAAAPACAR